MDLVQENIDLTTKYIMENIDKTLIMFVNPISGNQEGKIILNISSNYITQEDYKLILYLFFVFSLFSIRVLISINLCFWSLYKWGL